MGDRLKGLHCDKCNHEWLRRKLTMPKKCPRCQAPQKHTREVTIK